MLVQNVCFPGPPHSLFMNFKSSKNREDLEGYGAWWGNSYLNVVPLGFESSCVSCICSGFQLTDTPRSGAEEGKERPKRHPLAFKYNLQRSKTESIRIRFSDTCVSRLLKVRTYSIWQTFLKTCMSGTWIVGHEIGTQNQWDRGVLRAGKSMQGPHLVRGSY